jgi:hypothetical protein
MERNVEVAEGWQVDNIRDSIPEAKRARCGDFSTCAPRRTWKGRFQATERIWTT